MAASFPRKARSSSVLLRLEALESRLAPAIGLPLLSLPDRVLHVVGTEGPDVIILRQQDGRLWVDGAGNSFLVADVRTIEIDARGGDDYVSLAPTVTRPTEIRAGAGDDLVYGGNGPDVVFGEGGADTIMGYGGADYLDAGAGNDRVYGGAGDDVAYGDLGVDFLYGDEQNDHLFGGDDRDYLYGDAGRDLLDGGRGVDTLSGGEDYDTLADDPDGAALLNAGSDTFWSFHTGWFDMNLGDPGLRTLARFRYRDSRIDRLDAIDVLRQPADDGLVSTVEFADLRTLVAAGGSSALSMPEHVKNLAGKVVNGDRANAHYMTMPLGNLAAGSTGTQLNRLVNKWFHGSDLPWAPNTTYRKVVGSLYQGGISYEDVDQNGLGDCYFLAGLAAVARQAPDRIASMFIDNGDDTFTVRFFRDGSPEYVTVNRWLPTKDDGTAKYAGFGGKYFETDTELWVALAEKAYAQINESGWTGQDGENSYPGIEGGQPYVAMTQITGREGAGSMSLYSFPFSTVPDPRYAVIKAFQDGKAVTFSSYPDASSPISPSHAYALVGYDEATARFTLYNPHGPDSTATYLYLTWSQLRADFYRYEYVDL